MEDPNKTYATLLFLVKHGRRLADGTTIAVLLLGFLVAGLGGPLWVIPAFAGLSAFLFVLLRSYVEMVKVIVDMLLPK